MLHVENAFTAIGAGWSSSFEVKLVVVSIGVRRSLDCWQGNESLPVEHFGGEQALLVQLRVRTPAMASFWPTCAKGPCVGRQLVRYELVEGSFALIWLAKPQGPEFLCEEGPSNGGQVARSSRDESSPADRLSSVTEFSFTEVEGSLGMEVHQDEAVSLSLGMKSCLR